MCHSFEHWSRREANLIMHRLKSISVVALLLWISFAAACAQSTEQSSSGSQTPELSVRSNLVLVPALVKTKMGKLVFSLNADDFVLTDDGVPQPLRMEPGTLSQPLAPGCDCANRRPGSITPQGLSQSWADSGCRDWRRPASRCRDRL